MRIDGESFGSPIYGRRPTRPASAAGGSRRTASASSASSSRETSSLMAKLQEIPDVRAEVVEDVRQRLARGELMTREAAEQTAAAILSDLQSFLSP